MRTISQIQDELRMLADSLDHDHGTRSVRQVTRALRRCVEDLQDFRGEPTHIATVVDNELVSLEPISPPAPPTAVDPMLRVPRVEGQG